MGAHPHSSERPRVSSSAPPVEWRTLLGRRACPASGASALVAHQFSGALTVRGKSGRLRATVRTDCAP
eukprot:4526862-Alexandrium_andersonii.AAC.1